MARFRCSTCNQEYEDYYPPDDTCLKCNAGTIRIIQEGEPCQLPDANIAPGS